MQINFYNLFFKRFNHFKVGSIRILFSFYSKTTTRLSIKEELEELPLLRGAVKAAQRVIEAVQSGLSVDGSTLSDKSELDTLASRWKGRVKKKLLLKLKNLFTIIRLHAEETVQ